MTDKLYFGATTACRLNQQLYIFMRTQLLKKLSAVFCLGLLFGASYHAAAQISVGNNGTGTNTFDAQPTIALGWSTLTIAGAGGDITTVAALDSAVMANTTASAVTTALGSTTVLPPEANAIARWNNNATNGFYLQTRPTGNRYALLMATLRNNTGFNLAQATIRYSWAQRHPIPVVEEVPGHRAFYSLSGAPGSWTFIPEFSTFTLNDTGLALNVTLSLGTWTNGGNLYVIWADDNGSAGTGTGTGQEGSYTIDNFSLTPIATPPAIFAHPQSQSVAPGTPVVFTVGATGNPLIYQWRKNSNNIPNATNQSYTINSATVGDAGFYQVIVTNILGSATSTNAQLTIGCNAPVTFSTQPANQSLTSGSTLSLSATVAGTFPIKFQWYRNGAPISGATNTSYTKTPAVPGDSGFFYLVASNCFGLFNSSTAVVAVADVPFALVGLTNHVWRYEQSGTDLGTAWRDNNFDDSPWLSGRGILAREDLASITALTNTVLVLSNVSISKFVRTFYFRTHFTFTADPSLVTLTASNLFDDAAIVYLNGEELYRLRMPATGVDFDTLAAAGPATEGVYDVMTIPPNRLLFGDNVLAIEVHQINDVSSDAVMGFSLTVAFPPPVPLSITNQPQSVIVEDSHRAAFTVGVNGQPAYYQWYKDGLPLLNAATNPLVFPFVDLTNAGNYQLVVTNSINSVTSSLVTLTVITDTNRPALLEADGTSSATNVLVIFTDRVVPSTATNLANYKITNTLGGTLTITNAVIINGSNVLLTTTAPRLVNNNYLLIVNNVQDISANHNVILPNSTIPISWPIPIFSLTGGNWYYWYDALFVGDPPPGAPGSWHDFNYDQNLLDTEWAQGPAAFGHTGGIDLPVPPASNLPAGLRSHYFRNSFIFAGSLGGAQVFLRHAIDDGAVFYLNGVEVLRTNLPAGTILQTTLASVDANPGVSEYIELPASLLRSGTNVLAVELHQFSTDTQVDAESLFAAQMYVEVRSFIVGPALIVSQPANQTVRENETATFNPEIVAGVTFQWQRNGANMPGETNLALSIPNTPLSYSNSTFRVLVTGTNGATLTSSNALLTVIPDANRPALFGAYVGTNSITVTFTERVTAATAQTIGNYQVTNSAGTSFAITSAVLNNGSNVVLSFASLPSGAYYVVVNNVRDTSVASNVIAPNSVVRAGYASSVIAIGASWRYDDSNVDRGPSATWAARTYNDSSWKGPSNALFGAERGVAPNGTGGNFPALPIPVQTSLLLSNAGNSSGLSIYYFRTHFNSSSSGAGSMTFRTILDDGAIIYLNGVEIFRLRMADGASGFGTFAVGTAVGDAVYEGPFTVPVGNLLAGDNVIAVEVHQINGTSSDVEWAGEFAVNIPPLIIDPPIDPPCTVTPPAVRNLTYQRSGTNLVLSWLATPIVTNASTCATGLYTLQAALYLSNAMSTTVWTNVTTVSPYTVVVPPIGISFTNPPPAPGSTRFYRLKSP